MRSTLFTRTRVSAATIIALIGNIATAALPIDLEVATDEGAPPGSMQEWGRVLSTMDLARLRLRGRQRADEPKVTTTGDGDNKRYHVVGILNRRDELVMPGGRFTQGNASELKQFFQDFAERTEEAGVERGLFGLTKPQFEKLFAELKAPIAEPTKDRPLQQVVDQIKSKTPTPLNIDADAQQALQDAAPVAVELQGFSTGTALALTLRSAGLGFVPEQPRGKSLTMRVIPLSTKQLVWPVGWKPEAGPRQAAPAMYRLTMIEIENYTLDKALAALEPAFGVPLILDQRVMIAENIDPTEVPVKFPRAKSFIRGAVDRLLSQAKLQGEIRVDEAGRVFYWATQFGPDSPRATN